MHRQARWRHWTVVIALTRQERRTKRSKQLGRRAHNRSGRVVHADSEHRPRPPGGERSRFVSCYKSAALPAVAVITLVCSIATRCSSTGDPEDDMQSPAGDDARRPRYS
ncbi:hypothetical protein BRN52_03220 [Xanthomonas oryzae pv. oryzae]|nr:hypothetical protein BRM60_21655 [Xanthomonas oryzae pv. oryzae]AXM14914.1 hypothetical protein BRN32_21855 [Xanthomonas oryzae pv. oryzae]AXM18662.1 hypothetical protein BRN66_21425 [Xanthomonas oryzae pv. oryzae]AXM22524.1 hypothetical protein BRM88_21970 [Xanthomonas oryzae pv. oryzae]AXM26356.1 hypothetical protein BRM77_21625 [Xanthomonas oryzae pv. oryzae]